MTNEISKKQMCILIRSGIELWIDQERSQKLINVLQADDSRFIEFDGRLFNRADVVGIFNPQDLEEVTRRKNGQWQDVEGYWHEKGDVICKCGNVVPRGKTCGYCF